ncbi:MAG: response regulator [Gammaproteobacteria bacterium]|nr:response regulator [Gammaproteobacteria bacterium]
MIKILLAEDNELNRDMLSRRLQSRDYDVVIAVDGKQALEMVELENPDLILMDLSLPVVDGWEVTRKLKSNEQTRNIPLIVLTAHALKTDKNDAFKAGCDDYDVKPIDFPRLLSKIDAQLVGKTKNND